MGNTGLVRHPLYLEHCIDDYHPESPERLSSIYAMVEQVFGDSLKLLAPREATHEELAFVHDKSYIEQVAHTAGKRVRLDPDTGTSPLSYQAALLAAGGMFTAIDALFDGAIGNVFAAIRPPGHHAERNRAMGFCLFNNVALAAEYAIRRRNAKRVLIYDWDLHHGNGTQHSFDRTHRVLYVSTHQYPYYPGSGNFNEVGHGEGEGYTVNVPLSGGYGSGDYLAIVRRIIQPIALDYDPDLVIVSAGYDAYENDPLGAMKVTPEGYGALTHEMLAIARECAGGKLLVALEGGYHIRGLTDSVEKTLTVMKNGVAPAEWLHPAPLREDALQAVLGKVVDTHRRYWPALGARD
jgi:acetoin utilization deacetylase AcuC-like enzyme